MARQAHFGLRGHARGFGQAFALSDQDLRLNDVDACHLFGDSMFDLHAGVHFDEIELGRVHIHQKFNRARAFIAHMGTDAPT